jgi:hypothetical protein
LANEHILVTQKTIPVSYTVADGTAIAKGALLKMTTPRTAVLADGTSDFVAGIAAVEKIASDGRTVLAVIEGPGDQFKAFCSGTITMGQAVGTVASYPNYIISMNALTDVAISGVKRLGYAKESGTNGQQILYELNRGSGL